MKRVWLGTLGLAAALAVVPYAISQRSETRSLHGQTVDKSGAPLPNAVVYLKNTKSLQMRTYISDAGGAFRFQGLAQDVDYEVHAEHEGASSGVKTIGSHDTRKEINISLKIEKK